MLTTGDQAMHPPPIDVHVSAPQHLLQVTAFLHIHTTLHELQLVLQLQSPQFGTQVVTTGEY